MMRFCLLSEEVMWFGPFSHFSYRRPRQRYDLAFIIKADVVNVNALKNVRAVLLSESVGTNFLRH